jgi:hypothetical protein
MSAGKCEVVFSSALYRLVSVWINSMSTKGSEVRNHTRDLLLPNPSKIPYSRSPPPMCLLQPKEDLAMKAQKIGVPYAPIKTVSQTGYRFDDRSREKKHNSSLMPRLCRLATTASSSTATAHSPTATTTAVAAVSSPAATVSAASLCLRRRLLLFHNVDNLVGDAEVFDLWACAC